MTEEQDATARPERSLLSLTFSLHVEAVPLVAAVAAVVGSFFLTVVDKLVCFGL